MISLYAYYGLLDLHEIDSPGHSLYQIGLLDSIREEYRENKFDFFSYYPTSEIEKVDLEKANFPETNLGKIFKKYRDDLIYTSCIDLDKVFTNIANKSYSKLYLKARFRNLSALAKKWKDARVFEQIIELAIHSGYRKEQIIILDTDLSLPKNFVEKYNNLISMVVPSIDFPAVSSKFLNECIEVNLVTMEDRKKNAVFYGNLDTSKYKSGNQKNEILQTATAWLTSYYSKKHSSTGDSFIFICKQNEVVSSEDGIRVVARNNRPEIFDTLSNSLVMLNVTKDKYTTHKFIPARIYEAMLFGMIPVSYKFEFLSKVFSFETIDDLSEIIKYLDECDVSDLKIAYLHFINEYFKFVKV